MSRIVIAFGGNALGHTPDEQLDNLKKAAVPVAEAIAAGHKVLLTHGNGPQVGLISSAMACAYKNGVLPGDMPFPECGAMSQGYIGYHLQNALGCELARRGIERGVVSVVTQMLVDENDSSFKKPTKYVGAFMSEAEAQKLKAERGVDVAEDSGRGWRQVVPSPVPVDVIEKDAIKSLYDAGYIVVAAGGGGIPVARRGDALFGVPAVIDKDFAAARLAALIGADSLVILTAVDRVYIDFGKPEAFAIDTMSLSQANKYIEAGCFAPGSMLPKILAACSFVGGGNGRRAIIASLQDAAAALRGEAGTVITA